jgi:dihydroorotase
MTLKIRRPDDFHVHLRDGDMLHRVAEHTARQFARALVMPNVPPIDTGWQATDLRLEIRRLTDRYDFTPLMTIRLTGETTPETIRAAKAHGVVAAKVYPQGVTTGSHGGVTIDQLDRMGDVFAAMQEAGLVLCWHGEFPGPGWLSAEQRMFPEIRKVVDDFPRLRQVLEHISTRDGVEWVRRCPDTVAGTITVHHLYLTLDDLGGRGEYGRGGQLHPHYFYAPIAKEVSDRQALQEAAIEPSGKFFLGTDSAPHPIDRKFNVDAGCCAAGVFSAPVAMAALATKFEDLHALDRLENFTSVQGARFYGLPLNEGTIELEPRGWTVPETIAGMVPFLAGERLAWRVRPIESL